MHFYEYEPQSEGKKRKCEERQGTEFRTLLVALQQCDQHQRCAECKKHPAVLHVYDGEYRRQSAEQCFFRIVSIAEDDGRHADAKEHLHNISTKRGFDARIVQKEEKQQCGDWV